MLNIYDFPLSDANLFTQRKFNRWKHIAVTIYPHLFIYMPEYDVNPLAQPEQLFRIL